jgi:hypothetical protein
MLTVGMLREGRLLCGLVYMGICVSISASCVSSLLPIVWPFSTLSDSKSTESPANNVAQ